MNKLISIFENEFRKFGINNDDHVITYEGSLDTRFGASCRGYYLLNLLGHKNVNALNCGFSYWKAKKYPVSSVNTISAK